MSLAPRAAIRSGRTGLFALAHRRSTLVGVSSPWRVVRSIQVMARSSHAACHSFLTVRRVGIVAARRSTALRLTRTWRTQSMSRGIPGLRIWAGARSGAIWVPTFSCSVRRFVVVIRLFLWLNLETALSSASCYVYIRIFNYGKGIVKLAKDTVDIWREGLSP